MGVRRKYEELDAEKGTVEGEWRQYKDAFVGVAEELCGRTSGKGGTPRSRNQGIRKTLLGPVASNIKYT